MAWYPGATKMELQPESDAQEAIQPTQFIMHSIAAPWTPRRTYEYWRDSTNLESHFAIGYDGSIAQFIGTQTRADANYLANRRPDGTGAVSVETAANTQNSDAWTAEQIEELIKLGVWLHERHGLPLRICRTASDPGYGYHRLHPDWSMGGTACPGAARIVQFHEVVFPGIVARANGEPNPDNGSEENDVPNTLGRYDATDRPLAPGAWKTLDVEGIDLLTGARAYTAAVLLTLRAPAGGTVQGRFYHLRRDGTRWTSGVVERLTTAGDSFPDFAHAGSIRPEEKLRFEVAYWPADKADTTPLTITTSRARGLYWK
ncbi:N-acetylmuramoyl-L-alanine amidase [Streptomyces sp. SAJ15]|uniref:peptidoglycan recognition protein family protein n=1 Tax=Streptomyces sp. SAJ15 TaxID=2011095 RepID=UPI001185C094|nr:N-acetylmuramoyl-L-alanine amidase [Streptomyces sp. SAJ15]TVL89730.1 N-acetylmuramoyl-L-alanine amidase [Streptomyces sp. SAJ15]